jgi:hypothetical protein
MNHRYALLTASLLLALSAVPASAHKAHVHGEGRLDAVFDKDTITLALELPLDAVTGFERAPKNDKEKAALAHAEKIFNDAALLWQPTPAAGCVAHSVQVDMPKFDGGEHADLAARYVFRCANPAVLKGIETTLFRQFKRLYRLETQRAGPGGQGKQRLTPKAPVLNW